MYQEGIRERLLPLLNISAVWSRTKIASIISLYYFDQISDYTSGSKTSFVMLNTDHKELSQ